MITMEMPHIQLISEAISQLIFTNDPPKESLELTLQHRHMFVMPRCLKWVKKSQNCDKNCQNWYFGHFSIIYRNLGMIELERVKFTSNWWNFELTVFK